MRSIINSDFQQLIYIIYEALRIKQVISKHVSFTNLLIKLPTDVRFLTKKYCIKEEETGLEVLKYGRTLQQVITIGDYVNIIRK